MAEIEMIRQLKEQVLERFGEALKNSGRDGRSTGAAGRCCNTCDGFDDNRVR